jgi:hypothetical protein
MQTWKKTNRNNYFKGPAIPAGSAPTAEGVSAQSFYFVYNLRPKQDYLYFKVRILIEF